MPKRSNLDLVPFNFRLDKDTLRAFDAWLDRLNEGRVLGKINRSDLIRAVLAYAAREQPTLERLVSGEP
jgi:hypothetical protein